MMTPKESLIRWRLVLGSEAEQGLGCGLEGRESRMDAAIDYLYGREYGPGRNVRQRGQGTRGAGSEDSVMSVPDWINEVNELFPKRTIERLEKDALERYGINELVTNPELLARAVPSPTLLKAVLQTKHLMNEQVLALARVLVRKVIEAMLEKLSRPVRSVFLGARNRQRRSYQRVSKNFDAKSTIRRNLETYNTEEGQLYIRTPHFNSRIRRQCDRWQVIIVVDQSGSMVDSVIHSAITASIFYGIPLLKTHLVAFDTNIVDLTSDVHDPVETLMKVQLGGGTDIGGAMAYAATLIENPRRTIVVLITDFYEGGDPGRLYSVTRQMVESGATVLGLAALDSKADPNYDRTVAQTIANLGGHVGAMTPGELADFVAGKVK
ncbi:MAG: VWA domain-containing protein [Fimbriiglobus sp.]